MARGTLEHTISTLADLQRLPTSPGERQAAEWIARELETLGCRVKLEDEQAHGSFVRPVALLSAKGALAGVLALRGWRRVGVAGGALAAAGIAEDVASGPRFMRRFLRSRRTVNAVAETGDSTAGRTLVVLAHHDAAPSGVLFNQSPQKWVWKHFPALIDRTDTSLPLWWPAVGAPALVVLGSLLGSRRLTRVGVRMCLITVATLVDIGRRPAVPGANDNLTAVASLVEIARRLQENPVADLRVLLVSCGSEESLQEGILGFERRHFQNLPKASTWFVNLETLGSPELALLEGEGVLAMREYDESWKDFVTDAAAGGGVIIRRGLRSRSSTDGSITQRAGYPTVVLVSVNEYKALSNYHLPSDTPENVNYETVGQAIDATEATIRALASS
jgi:Zn-dependent M28 family amino/carboxypeptidase